MSTGSQTETEPLLNVEDLTVAYEARKSSFRPSLSSVSFRLQEGEFVAVLGESGAGKTTLARAIVRLLPIGGRVLQGRVSFCGQNLNAMSERRIAAIRGAGIAMMLQEPGVALNPVIRAIDQVAEVIRAHTRADRNAVSNSAKIALEQVGLHGYGVEHAYPHQLSGGQRQRLLLAMSLAAKPKLLIADEPTSAADSETRTRLKGVLNRIRETSYLSTLWITHDPFDIINFAHRVLVFYAGELMEDALAADLRERSLHPYTKLLLASAAPPARSADIISKRLPVFPGPVATRGCSFAPRCPQRIEGCSDQKPALVQLSNGTRVRCIHYVQ